MIEYRQSHVDDVNSLKELWFSSFDDTQEAVDMFFAKKYPEVSGWIATDKGKLVSMLYLFPAMVNGRKACYLYGAATAEEYRKQGIMRTLIDTALKNIDAEMCVLLPAKDSLYDFYSKLGFVNLSANFAHLNRETVEQLAKPYQVQDLVVSNYCGARNRVLKKDFLFWNNNHISYAFEYNKLYGAKIIKSNYGYALAFEDDGICNVLEIITSGENAPKILTDILSEFSSKEFYFHLSPEQKFVKSNTKPFGMVRFLSDYKIDNIYCGLTLE